MPSKSEVASLIKNDYDSLLHVSLSTDDCQLDIVLPDPLKLDDGWLAEYAGVSHWPPCSYVNISEFLVDRGERSLLTRLANDYKEGQ